MIEQLHTRRPRIAFVHTVAGLVELFRGIAERELAEAEVFHILNESLLQDLLKNGPSAAITRRIVQQAMLAADADVDLVVFTCSSSSPAIDHARTMIGVPVIKIDDPMAREAACSGGRIAIVCTTQSTMTPSRGLIEAHAAELGTTPSIEVRLVEGAFDALRAGRRAEHDALVTSAAQEIAAKSDVLVLAQASLAHLRDPLAEVLPLPVLSSPPLLIAELRRRLGFAR